MTVAISEFTGLEIDTFSEAWRYECECSAILKIPTRNARLTFLNLVAKHRGQPAADQLKRDAERLFYTRKNRAAAAQATQRYLHGYLGDADKSAEVVSGVIQASTSARILPA